MASEDLLDKCKYVQQLMFFQCGDELCDFFDVLVFHGGIILSSGAGYYE
jgi:hypothetical protein